MSSPLRSAPLAGVLALLAACGAPQAPGVSSRSMDDTAVGRARCEDARTHQLKPFIVEWDATDLAGFEAKAARDLVFVKYEGCSLTVLDGCSDGAVPGRYGKYAPPHFTSGTLEGIEMKNEDELYANLPLGVASFGGRVSRGEQLRLSYFVTGVATATRDTVPRAELAKNPACAEATHFVWAYHLGAFALDSGEQLTAGASAGIGAIGGGAEHRSSEQHLKRGGDLENCKTQTQQSCRVPIRVVLRKLGDGGAEQADVAGAAPPPAPPPVYENTPAGQASALRRSAKEKEQRAGDGVGCLADLDRAARIDPNGARSRDVLYTRALCLMRAGQCEEGKKLHTDFMKAGDEDRALSDDQIAQSTQALADAKCPSSQGTPAEQARRAMARVAEATQQKNAAACIEEAARMERLATKLTDPGERATANGVIMQAALCAGASGRCDEAKRLWDRYYQLQFGSTMKPDELRKTAAQTFPAAVRGCAAK
ncbi:MAG: hypothetical protein OZ921_07075 [Sorangiineae bacterium]|nr:hypothetical protein [Polyangiaceae bacterium]MEB2322258.1 hypothetical protein [Sorangiineae bacterium]